MIGLLLINLGTPEDPEAGPVREYLREFLNDPRVLDINPLGRAALLNVILRTRPKKSSNAYKQIWTGDGSPLMVHSRALTAKVRARMANHDWVVELGMRYGQPSIQSAIDTLIKHDVDQIVVFPLYPQYAASSTGTALEEVYRICAPAWNVIPLHVVSPFYRDPGFIDSFIDISRPLFETFKPDHILFSYHGLPERHLKKSDPNGSHCLAEASCCDHIVAANKHCYRAQCYATTRALVSQLNLEAKNFSVSFQSRLGRTPWIKPHTDVILPQLAASGIKRLAVFCPSFVADCLETLEEIAIRGAEQFQSSGGEALILVPSLNSSDRWVETVCTLAQHATPK